jgi:hypothetical protein
MARPGRALVTGSAMAELGILAPGSFPGSRRAAAAHQRHIGPRKSWPATTVTCSMGSGPHQNPLPQPGVKW